MKRYLIFAITSVFVILCSSSVFAERLAVSSSVANIRSGPGKNYRVLWKAKKNYPLNVLEKSDKWVHFRNYEGNEGWIHRSLVSKVATVITKSRKCNIRRGPGTSHRVSATVGKGLSFRIIGRDGRWLKIKHAGGFIGWINESLVW